MDPEALVLGTQAVAALQAMASLSPAWTEVVVAVGGIIVGAIQCLLIAIGLRRMGQAADDRKRQHDETMRRMENQHHEAMTALKNQREESQRQHTEAMSKWTEVGAPQNPQDPPRQTASMVAALLQPGHLGQ